MKKRAIVLAVSFLFLASSIIFSAIPDEITYQGRLLDGGSPVTGTKSIYFELYNSASGGTQLWSETQNAVAFSNDGIYTVQLGSVTSIPATLFNTYDSVWLQVTIDGAGGTQLSPRRQLTLSPYARKADTVDGIDAADLEESAEIDTDIASHAGITSAHHTQTSSLPFASITGTASDAQIPNDITINYASGAGNADTVDGAHAAALEESAEIDSDIASHAAIASAHHTQTTSLPFASITGTATDAQVSNDISINNGRLYAPSGSGNVGIGTPGPSHSLHVALAGAGPSGYGDIAIFERTNTGEPDLIIESLGGASNPYIGLKTSGSFGFLVGSAGYDARSESALVIKTDGNIGIGTTNPQGRLMVQDSATNDFIITSNVINFGYNSNENRGWWINNAGYQGGYTQFRDLNIGDGKGNTVAFFDGSSGNVGIGTPTPTAKLKVSNPETANNYNGLYIDNDELSAYGLQIGGNGSFGIALEANPASYCWDQSSETTCSLNDYAEMMEFSEMPENSDVIIIDTENPGLLKISDKPYDRLAAGIASEDPAMVIGSYGITIKGWEDGNREDGIVTYPLAISGRKRIKVSEENGKIQPGDMLVTSSEPGKAMKCNKEEYLEKCVGAILGKAMTSIGEDGKVLALITLQ